MMWYDMIWFDDIPPPDPIYNDMIFDVKLW